MGKTKLPTCGVRIIMELRKIPDRPLTNKELVSLFDSSLKHPDKDPSEQDFFDRCRMWEKEKVLEVRSRFGKDIQKFYVKKGGEYLIEEDGSKKVFSRIDALALYYSDTHLSKWFLDIVGETEIESAER